MKPDLDRAILLLEGGNYTCVLCKGTQTHTSKLRGVMPLMELLHKDMSGFSAADKVVGKATALLYCLLGVDAVHATVISEPALAVLESHGIQVSYSKTVPYIVNRQGNGTCPMELATANITVPEAAPAAIRAALEKLKQGDPTP